MDEAVLLRENAGVGYCAACIAEAMGPEVRNGMVCARIWVSSTDRDLSRKEAT